MDKKMRKITVTARNSKFGLKNNVDCCPIALGARATFRCVVYVSSCIEVGREDQEVPTSPVAPVSDCEL